MLAIASRDHGCVSCDNQQKEKRSYRLDHSLALLPHSTREIIAAGMPPTAISPDSVLQNESTALHLALENECGKSILKMLLKKYPDACRVRDSFGNIPLHIAAYNSSLDTINLLLQEYSEGIRVQNNEGALPLHYAAARNKNSAVVARLLEEDYSGSSVATSKSTGTETPLNSIVHSVGYRTPLHLAVYFNPSEEVSMLLLLANQGAGDQVDERGDYPIHLALSHCHEMATRCKCSQCHAMCAHVRPSTRSELFMHTLLGVSRRSLSVWGQEGYLPLHMACMENMAPTTIQLIADMYPAAIALPCYNPSGSATDRRGRYYQTAWGSWPFHCAIRNSDSNTVAHFLKHMPGLWCELDSHGRTALHHLVQSTSSFMRSSLYRIDPCWAAVKCSSGWLPLHYACFSSNNESAYHNFQLVLAMNPEALFCGAGEDEAETPLALAARFGHLDIVQHILEKTSYECNGLEVPIMFAMRADTIRSTQYFQMLHYLCKLQLALSSQLCHSLGSVSLQFLLCCRQFWTRKGMFQQQIAIVRYIVACNPSAVGQIGGWERRRNAFAQFMKKTSEYMTHFSVMERNDFARVLLEAVPHVNLRALRNVRWISRRAAFVVRYLRSQDETVESFIAKLPEKIFRAVVLYL